jgi:hypothetical protein
MEFNFNDREGGNVPLDALTITTFDSGCILVQERLSLPYNRKIYL